MSRIDEWDENERALYAVGTRAILDDLERQRREWNESYALDSTSMDEINRAHSERMRKLEEDQRAWLARWLDGDADEGRPANVGQQAPQDASASGGPATPGPGSAGQPNNPYDAELERAHEIKDMDMATYAALRAELGVRSPTSMDHLFRQETR